MFQGFFRWLKGEVKAKPRPIARPTGQPAKQVIAPARESESKEIEKLAEKIESDYQFKLGYLVIKALVESATVSIEGANDDPRATALADNLVKRFDECRPKGMEAFGRGRAAFERLYEISASGMAFVRPLNYLPFRYTEMVLTEDGSFGGIKLNVSDKAEDAVLLEPARSWWFALDSTMLEPHGRSRYLGAAYEVYRQRCRLKENEDVFLDRFALGHGVAKAPNAYEKKGINQKGEDGLVDMDGSAADPMDDLRAAIDAARSGGTVILDSAVDQNGNELFGYSPTEGQPDASPLESRRQVLDAAALRSIGVPERSVTQDAATGSYSMSETHLDVLFSTCDGILTQLVSSFQQYVIDKAVAINWPAGQGPKLTMVYRKLRDTKTELVTEILKTVLASADVSPLISEGVLDLEAMLDIADLPTGADVKAAMVRVQQSAQQAAQQPKAASTLPIISLDPRMPWDPVSDRAETLESPILADLLKSIEDRNEINRGLLRRSNGQTGGDHRQGDHRSDDPWPSGPLGPDGEVYELATKKAPAGVKVLTGPKGGSYYLTKGGKKVYVIGAAPADKPATPAAPKKKTVTKAAPKKKATVKKKAVVKKAPAKKAVAKNTPATPQPAKPLEGHSKSIQDAINKGSAFDANKAISDAANASGYQIGPLKKIANDLGVDISKDKDQGDVIFSLQKHANKAAAEALKKNAAKPKPAPAIPPPMPTPSVSQKVTRRPDGFQVDGEKRNEDPVMVNGLAKNAQATKLDEKQMAAIKDYTGSGFVKINETIRKNPDIAKSASPFARKAKAINAAIENAPSIPPPKDAIVYRGVGSNHYEKQIADAKAALSSGKELVMDGIVSTTTNPKTAGSFGQNLVIEIKPKKGLFIPGVPEKLSGYSEQEMIMRHQSRYRVVEVNENASYDDYQQPGYDDPFKGKRKFTVIRLEEL